jgi:hypothetical protein
MKTNMQAKLSGVRLGRLPFLLAGIGMLLCGATQMTWAAAPAATSTTLTLAARGGVVTTVASGTVVTLTAKVEVGASAVTSGKVNFCDASAKFCSDIHILGDAQLTSSGTAVLKFVPGIGTHAYKAVFLGTRSHAASTSGVSALDVTGTYATATTVAQSVVAGTYRLTATVEGFGAKATPTGTVSLLDLSNGNHELAAVSLGKGKFGLSWSSSSRTATGLGPYSVAVGDFNRDGFADLTIANYDDGFPSSVTILLGNGKGGFAPAAQSPVAVGDGPMSVAVGDFNGDGIQDLAVANNGSFVTILLGNGNGTFTQAPKSPIMAGLGPISVAVTDFNKDGNADLAVLNESSQTVTILLGNGNGTFTQAPSSPVTGTDPFSLAVGDFNGDGAPDLAVANMIDNTVTILLGKGDGTFTQAPDSPLPVGINPLSVTVADFNQDGVPDLAIADHNGFRVSVFLGNGNGTFRPAPNSPLIFTATPTFVGVADFNLDGIPDLAVAEGSNGSVSILLGKGDGTFTPALNSPGTGDLPFSVGLGDFNGDGIPDIAYPNYLGDTVTAFLTRFTQIASTSAAKVPLMGFGDHKVEASYPGDDVYRPGISSPITLVPTPWASLSASSVAFGNQKLGTASGKKTLTLTNTGNATLTIGGIALRGTSFSSFLLSYTCGKSLSAGAVCTISLQFDPKTLGAAAATLDILDNAPASPQNIALSGTGIDPVVALSKTSVPFGPETVGVKSPAQVVQLTNKGNVALTITSPALTGAHASSFRLATTCGKSLAAGAACTISLNFDPNSVGAVTAAVTISDNAAGSPQSIALSGTGIAAAASAIP